MLTKPFAFLVWDDRNAPEFRKGDRVVIDPVLKPAPGNMVFAVAGGEPVFGLCTRLSQRRSQWTCVLGSLNTVWGVLPADRIIGVMCHHAKPGSKPRSDASCP
jgi:hypothetical protein